MLDDLPAYHGKTDPLLHTLDARGQIRIEGHHGRFKEDVSQAIEHIRTTFNLSFDVIVARLGPAAEDGYGADFEDLRSLYAVLRAEAVCQITEVRDHITSLGSIELDSTEDGKVNLDFDRWSLIGTMSGLNPGIVSPGALDATSPRSSTLDPLIDSHRALLLRAGSSGLLGRAAGLDRGSSDWRPVLKDFGDFQTFTDPFVMIRFPKTGYIPSGTPPKSAAEAILKELIGRLTTIESLLPDDWCRSMRRRSSGVERYRLSISCGS